MLGASRQWQHPHVDIFKTAGGVLGRGDGIDHTEADWNVVQTFVKLPRSQPLHGLSWSQRLTNLGDRGSLGFRINPDKPSRNYCCTSRGKQHAASKRWRSASWPRDVYRIYMFNVCDRFCHCRSHPNRSHEKLDNSLHTNEAPGVSAPMLPATLLFQLLPLWLMYAEMSRRIRKGWLEWAKKSKGWEWWEWEDGRIFSVLKLSGTIWDQDPTFAGYPDWTWKGLNGWRTWPAEHFNSTESTNSDGTFGEVTLKVSHLVNGTSRNGEISCANGMLVYYKEMDREICKHVFRIQGAVRGLRACRVLGKNGRKGGRGESYRNI